MAVTSLATGAACTRPHLRRARSGSKICFVLRWIICGSSSKPVPRRVIPAILIALVLAIFGTVLVTLTQEVTSTRWMQAAYVLVVVVALKFPLLAILWWLIARNSDWPGTGVNYTPDDQAQIFAYLESEAQRAEQMPDAIARLAYLSQEAWHLADHLEGHAKVDALTVALRVDLIASRANRQHHAS